MSEKDADCLKGLVHPNVQKIKNKKEPAVVHLVDSLSVNIRLILTKDCPKCGVKTLSFTI